MSLIRGSVSLLSYRIKSLLKYAEIANSIDKYKFIPISNNSVDTSSIGFCDWKDLTKVPNEDNSTLGDWILLGIRVDGKNVPKSLIDLKVKEAFKASIPGQKFDFY